MSEFDRYSSVEVDGHTRCFGCENGCTCIEGVVDGNLIRVGQIIQAVAGAQEIPLYFSSQIPVKQCIEATLPLIPETDANDSAQNNADRELFARLQWSMLQAASRIKSPDNETGYVSEQYICSILQNNNLCPWVVDAWVSDKNSLLDQNGIDIIVMVSEKLQQLLGSPVFHVQVKTNAKAFSDFIYGFERKMLVAYEKDKLDPYVCAHPWEEQRMVVLAAGKGKRQANQVVYELLEQLKAHAFFHSTESVTADTTDLEDAFCSAVVYPQVSRWGRDLEAIYQRDYKTIIAYLSSIREQWADPEPYFQTIKQREEKKLEKKKSTRTKPEKGDFRNNGSKYGNGVQPHYFMGK